MPQTAVRPPIEVADILRVHGDDYRRAHSPPAAQRAVMRHIIQCRTAALGGHVDRCDSCNRVRISYNSCRDRHCPKCQSLKKAEWLEARRRHLLPTAYWHLVFTLPDTLRPLALRNKPQLFNLLFECAAQTLQTIARDPKHLGAQVGFTAVLHSWGQKLQFHPHLHCVVTGGGLDPRGNRWVRARPRFFLPVEVLARLFRGKFLHRLQELRQQGKLDLAGSTAALVDPSAWRRLLDQLYHTKWVVYAKPPFGGPDHVFRYLGRYTHRVAIANHRLLALQHGKVRFNYRDYADGDRKKILDLSAAEFIRRFLLHVLPRGFVRIRHYGLLAARNVHTKLDAAREILGTPKPEDDPDLNLPWWQRLLRLTGIDLMLCPYCHQGRLTRANKPVTISRGPPS